MVKKNKLFKKFFKFILIIGIILFFIYFSDFNFFKSDFENVKNGIGKVLISENEILTKYNLNEEISSDIKVYFCQSDDCLEPFQKEFLIAKKSIKCAFYDFDMVNLAETLVEKTKDGVSVSLIIDDNYLDEWALKIFKNSKVDLFSDINRGTKYNNYMHHKFCIIDDNTLISGSANPTERGLFENDNNVLIIKSKYLVKNYENEFNLLRSGKFGQNKFNTLEYNNITLINKKTNKNIKISSFMCPQNSCDKEILKKLDDAKEEILFATFAFTHDKIRDKLIELNNKNIKIKGIVERRNYNLKGSDVKELNKYFIVKNDTNSKTMHHKFFIIDKKIVITGSMNPSSSGANYNDENILIIKDYDIAKKYVKEFYRMYD